MTTDDKHGQTKTWDALNTRGLTAKREAVHELELRADDEAIRQLVECLRDESWYLRDLSEAALVRLGRRASSTLLPLLDQGLWFSRASAARIFGKIGDGDAVPALFAMTRDANHTVGAAALDSLLAIGHQRGAVRLAHALHRMAPQDRAARLDEIQSRDPALGERLRRFLKSDELMSVEDTGGLSDDSAAVRASEEGVEWEVLTGPPHPKPQHRDGHGGDA
jgi:HEAT repeat protein